MVWMTVALLLGQDVDLVSPYRSQGTWYKGQLHAHAMQKGDDGIVPPDRVAKAYRDAGFHFLALTSHSGVVDHSTLNEPGKFLMLPGHECGFRAPDKSEHHMTVFGLASFEVGHTPDHEQPAIDLVNARGGFVTLCHPNMASSAKVFDYSDAALEALEGYHAIEIVSGIQPIATAKWDRLLAAGRAVWGTAVDDYHGVTPPGRGYVMVQIEELTEAAVITALRAGRFYASTGLHFERIRTDGRAITVEVDRKAVIRFVNGKTLKECEGTSASYEVAGDEGYVRVEAIAGKAQAFTQPIWVDRRDRRRVVAVQFGIRSYANADEFRSHVCAMLERALRYRPELVVFPEGTALGLQVKDGKVDPDVRPVFERTFSELARRAQVTIVAGSGYFIEGGKLRNVTLTFGPDGTIAGKSCKVRLNELDRALGAQPGDGEEAADFGASAALVGEILGRRFRGRSSVTTVAPFDDRETVVFGLLPRGPK